MIKVSVISFVSHLLCHFFPHPEWCVSAVVQSAAVRSVHELQK